MNRFGQSRMIFWLYFLLDFDGLNVLTHIHYFLFDVSLFEHLISYQSIINEFAF